MFYAYMRIYTPAFTGPPVLSVNIMKNIESSSIVVQWDAAYPSLATNYTVTWTSETDPTLSVATTEQTSYIITGLILDTVYTITVTAANRCGQGPEFSTSISFPTGTYIATHVLCRFYTLASMYFYTDVINSFPSCSYICMCVCVCIYIAKP